MKLHLEQKRSEKLVCKLDEAGRHIEKMGEEFQECRRLMGEKDDTNRCLHEALERQDLVLEDARYVNLSYQESFLELQARAELRREDTMARSSTLGGAQSGAVGGEPTVGADTPTPNPRIALPRGRPRRLRRIESGVPRTQESNPSKIPVRQQQRRSNRQPLPRSPPATDGTVDERRDSPEPRSASSGSRSPVLPEPSEGDLASLYDQAQARVGGAEIEVDVPLAGPAGPVPRLSIEELEDRTDAAASFFENARKLLDDMSLGEASPPDEEGAAASRRKPIYQSGEPARLTAEGDFEILKTRSGATSALSFEVVPDFPNGPSAAPQPDITDDWLHCMPPHSFAAPQSHSASEPVSAAEAASHPPSPAPDIWVEEARHSGGGRALPGPRQPSRCRCSGPNSDVPSGLALSSPVVAPRRAFSLREPNGRAFRSQSISGGVQGEGTPTNFQHCLGTPSASEPAERADAKAPQVRTGSVSPVSRTTTATRKCPASFVGSVARKLRFPYVGSPKKPRVLIPRAGGGGGPSSEGRGEMEAEEGQRGWEGQQHIGPPSPMLSKSSWESVGESPVAEKGFLRSTIAARNRATNRRAPWVPAGGVPAGRG